MNTAITRDLICLGRAGVDLYAQQIGSRLEDVQSFAKYIGGSSTNTAACAARMGLKSALITRVGNEHLGRFILEQLQREGVDTSHVHTDPERPTAMVVLGIKDRDTFPLVFVRENCADMAIQPSDFDETFIASSRALAITGTHFSQPGVYQSCMAALEHAKKHGVRRALDIDYRPVLWGLTERGDGETRFVADEKVSEHLQGILPHFDLIVGTEEEIHIAGGSTDTIAALKAIRAISAADIVLKRGPYGASVYSGDIPETLDEGVTVKGVTVEVLNVLGAGDAFMAGFLRGWIRGEGHEQSLRYANACGALVVSRHGCTPAMPTVPELDYYLQNAQSIARPDTDIELNHLHRVTTRHSEWEELCIHAFDHRGQLIKMVQECGADLQQLPKLKQLLVSATQTTIEATGIAGRAGILCDGTFGQDALNAASGRGWWIGRPVEQPSSRPLTFEYGDSIGSHLISWPKEHVVKCLVFYHPDDEAMLRYQQERKIISLYEACCVSGHELLVEIIPPADSENKEEAVFRSVKRFYNLGVRPDWWKLPSLSRPWAEKTSALIDERDAYCHGILILGLDAPIDELCESFKAFAGLSRVKGFAVGRSIFGAPSRAWLSGEIDDDALKSQIQENYSRLIQAWQQRA